MLNFVGPGYQLDTRKADVQRSVNLYPKRIESGSGKAEYILEEIPGLQVFGFDAALGSPVRGLFTVPSGNCYTVIGSNACSVSSTGVVTSLGTLLTSTGVVEFAVNTDHLCIVDGAYGYTINLMTNAFAQIVDAAFYGSKTVAIIDGYMLFVRPDTGQFYISGFNDLTTFDALDFATAESSPDNLSAVIADHGQARLFGTLTTEGWFNSGGDFPFSRDPSAYSQIGTSAPYSVRLAANSVLFLGQSEEGSGVVYIATGNSIQRASTHAVEDSLAGSTDLSGSRAYVYQDKGHLFYVLNAPGLETTWVYDLSTQAWHERAELLDGAYIQHRAICHTYAFGLHLFGGSDGVIYNFSRASFAQFRDRISPHNAGESLEKLFFGIFELDATCGDASDGLVPVVQMRYSNDGGRNWSDWRSRELGRTGETKKRVRWIGNGSGRDRVWHVRCTSAAPFSIIQAKCPVGLGDG